MLKIRVKKLINLLLKKNYVIATGMIAICSIIIFFPSQILADFLKGCSCWSSGKLLTYTDIGAHFLD
jgi:hypothetical protein